MAAPQVHASQILYQRATKSYEVPEQDDEVHHMAHNINNIPSGKLT